MTKMEGTNTCVFKFGDVAVNLKLIQYIKFEDDSNIVIGLPSGENLRIYESMDKLNKDYLKDTGFTDMTPKQIYEMLIIEWVDSLNNR